MATNYFSVGESLRIYTCTSIERAQYDPVCVIIFSAMHCCGGNYFWMTFRQKNFYCPPLCTCISTLVYPPIHRSLNMLAQSLQLLWQHTKCKHRNIPATKDIVHKQKYPCNKGHSTHKHKFSPSSLALLWTLLVKKRCNSGPLVLAILHDSRLQNLILICNGGFLVMF